MHHTECCKVGVHGLTEKDLNDPDVHWWKNDCDLQCTGLNVKFVLVRMTNKKNKKSGKTSSFGNICKINDTILFGAEQVGQCLPPKHCAETDKFLHTVV